MNYVVIIVKFSDFIDINGRNPSQITQITDSVAFDGVSMIICCRSDREKLPENLLLVQRYKTLPSVPAIDGRGEMPDQVGHDGAISISSAHNSQPPQRATQRLPGALRRIPGRGSRRSCRGRDSPSVPRRRGCSSGCRSRLPSRDRRRSSPSGVCAREATAPRLGTGNRQASHQPSSHGRCNKSSRVRSSTACRQRWCGWRPGRHSFYPAAGTKCSRAQCAPGVRHRIPPV